MKVFKQQFRNLKAEGLKFNVKPYGENAVFLEFGQLISKDTHLEIKFLYRELRKHAKIGVVAVIPSYCGLTILFEPKKLSKDELIELCQSIQTNFSSQTYSSYRVVIPVCYADRFALDKVDLMKHTCLSWEEILEIHCQTKYLVYMLGFVPGFFYLGGMDERIAIPRKETPRLKVPKGAVAIGDKQTGVYPAEISGGWQIIGKTPVNFISDQAENQIEMGDTIVFEPISIDEYDNYTGRIKREIFEH